MYNSDMESQAHVDQIELADELCRQYDAMAFELMNSILDKSRREVTALGQLAIQSTEENTPPER